MKLSQYWQCLDLLKKKLPIDVIKRETRLPLTEVILMSRGARIAPYILLHKTDVWEKCPECGHKVLLPCYYCFCRRHPDAYCIECIPRPIRNQDMPLTVMLDVQILSGEDPVVKSNGKDLEYEDSFELDDEEAINSEGMDEAV